MATPSVQSITRQVEAAEISQAERRPSTPPEAPIQGLECLPFDPPDPAQLSAIPRYLFRAYSPHSLGSTDETWVRSRDVKAGHENASKDIFQTTPRQSTARGIADHLNWAKDERKDNLMSWTSSLLFAVHLVLYRQAKRKDATKRDGSAMSDIKICIIDTTLLPDRTFIRDMDLINAFKANHQNLRSLHDLRTGRRGPGTYYFCEYLSQGSLNVGGKCQIVSAEAMMKSGLLSLQTEFTSAYQNAECGWAEEVRRVRKTFQGEGTATLDPEQIKVAIRIAQLFGPMWRLPVAISLVALLPGRIDADEIKTAFSHRGDFNGMISFACFTSRYATR
ncbi:hypothetical protein BDY17DRAFT_257447 [Neohortaea acidophila]|uniref:DUF7587 domain-containing protein n=1 Tax=Neohortaea acidophila TaxID=245834 RepID=A0A6A6PHC9_9PEZI|nr:uncharacterized protein BDY17DRAFT_257447 [Neohortaea acidophila]KAF2479409.1 hypothetical protein BDY17DRAFT_257447 [Neohortaea acidophila]